MGFLRGRAGSDHASRERSPPPTSTVEAFGEALIAPDAGERLSPAGGVDAGPGAIVLDLDASAPDQAARWSATVQAALPSLPCVTIAFSAGDDPAGVSVWAPIIAACDVVITDRADLAPVLEGVAARPIAALAFVQLLRGSATRSIVDGLIAESFVYSTLQSGREFGDWLARRRRERRRRRPEPAANVCRFERDRDSLELCLTRPHKHNAFSSAMRDALCEGLQVALADRAITRVVLVGEGESFCSGGDLDEFGAFPDPAAAHAIRTTRSPALLLARLSERTRTEAHVHGACIGAGAELPAFTRHVVAREDAFFQLPEISLGLVPGAGGTVSLPRRIGRQKTAWLGLSGARIDARTALAWGLVDELRLEHHPRPDR